MSKLSEMIARLCPNGVEYKKLGEIAETGLAKIARGNVISKKDIQSNPGNYPIYSSSATGDGEFGRYGKYMFEEELVTWSIDGGGKFFYRERKKFSVTNVCGYIRVENSKVLLPKFLYHVLASQWATKSYDYTHKALPSTIIDDYSIPLPPLPVQREIVQILDNFANLTAELTAELAKRKKQYEHYREKLMQFDADVPFVPLNTLFPLIRNGFVGTVTKYFTEKENGIRYLEGKNIHNGVIADNEELYVAKEFHQKHIKSELKADDILMVQSGHIGECAVVGEKYKGSNCHALIIMSNGGKCISKFYVHYFYTVQGMQHLKPAITDGNLKHVLAGKMGFVKVPYPPIEKQVQIVKTLDHFEQLCNSLTEGLPAEIELRKKQYEYYRDKLLSFKEAS